MPFSNELYFKSCRSSNILSLSTILLLAHSMLPSVCARCVCIVRRRLTDLRCSLFSSHRSSHRFEHGKSTGNAHTHTQTARKPHSTSRRVNPNTDDSLSSPNFNCRPLPIELHTIELNMVSFVWSRAGQKDVIAPPISSF